VAGGRKNIAATSHNLSGCSSSSIPEKQAHKVALLKKK